MQLLSPFPVFLCFFLFGFFFFFFFFFFFSFFFSFFLPLLLFPLLLFLFLPAKLRLLLVNSTRLLWGVFSRQFKRPHGNPQTLPRLFQINDECQGHLCRLVGNFFLSPVRVFFHLLLSFFFLPYLYVKFYQQKIKGALLE